MGPSPKKILLRKFTVKYLQFQGGDFASPWLEKRVRENGRKGESGREGGRESGRKGESGRLRYVLVFKRK